MDSDQDGRDEPQSLQLDSQTQTLIDTQQELAKVKDDLGQAAQTIGRLFLEKEQSQQHIRALEEQLDEFRRTRPETRPETKRSTTSSAADGQDELLTHSRELNRTRAELKSSEDEQKRLKEVVKTYKRQLSGLHQELQEMKSICQQQGEELVGAKVFLGKADTVSIPGIIQKVDTFNEEIFQAAATLGDLAYKPPEAAMTTETTRFYIGERLVNLCKRPRNRAESSPNPLLVQVLLQTFLVMFCRRVIQSWSPNDPTSATALEAVYNKMKEKEDQLVAGRWRSLTRTYTRPAVEGWKKLLLQDLGHVLRVVGWTSTAEQRKSFRKKLDDVLVATQELRNALGEDYTSADLDIGVMKPDQFFDPYHMEDAYGNAGQRGTHKQDSQEIVVGTVGIGLKTKSLVDGEVLFQNLLSTRVALESTLIEALPPPPREPGRRRRIDRRNMG